MTEKEMTISAQISALRDAVGAGTMAPNEARAKLGLLPVSGGASPYRPPPKMTVTIHNGSGTSRNAFRVWAATRLFLLGGLVLGVKQYGCREL